MKKKTALLLIGSGRLAKHLDHWFNLSKNPHTFLRWDRSQTIALLESYLKEVSHVWLAISDHALTSFYAEHLESRPLTTVHFSGAFYDRRMLSAHPLMTFSHDLYALEVYQNIHFALTGAQTLQEALPGFENTCFELRPELKPLYHALCVVAGNFPQMLWSEVEKTCLLHQIPFKGFEPYIEQVAKNFIHLKQLSLTGPFIRQDTDTIKQNRAALSGNPLQVIYHSFEKEFLR